MPGGDYRERFTSLFSFNVDPLSLIVGLSLSLLSFIVGLRVIVIADPGVYDCEPLQLGEFIKRIDYHMNNIELHNSAVSSDPTKTDAKKLLMISEKADTELMGLVSALQVEFSKYNDAIIRYDESIKEKMRYKDTAEVLLSTRYGDSIHNKGKFSSLVRTEFETARLVLKDPLTRIKFDIKEGSILHQTAKDTVARHTLGDDGFERYQSAKQKSQATQEYGNYLADAILNNLGQTSGEV